MFPPFPQELAHHYCIQLISRITSGKVELKQIARESKERKDQGVMIGSLVCWNKTEQRRVVLYAVSGNGKILLSENTASEIFIPSLVSVSEIENALLKNDRLIHELTEEINNPHSNSIEELLEKRKALTTESLANVFSLYRFTRFDGKKISLNDIIKKHNYKLPPTGTGDCCAPKLLSYAFEHELEPVSMDEVYYGGNTKNKISGESYPPCDERCGYILPEILGLEILYRDNDIVIVNKQSGLLSVPGRGEEKFDCVEWRLKQLIPECLTQCAVHRLDMETSGILILALNRNSHKNLEMQFAEGTVRKTYVALLDGVLKGQPEGHIELKSRLDTDNRPYQIYDEENGKLGITDWKKLSVEIWKNPDSGSQKKVTRIEFSPKTGRTHQLRLASAFEKGLGIPILGDTLYGTCEKGERLMLHACRIVFNHPASGEQMIVESAPDF